MLDFFSKRLTGNPPKIATITGVNAMLTTNKPIGCLVDSRMAIIKTPLHISVYSEKINMILNERFMVALSLEKKYLVKKY